MPAPSERFERSMTKDNLWIYILTLLKERDMYPYEIRGAIKERFSFSPGNVTAYIVLKKLSAGGYVKVLRKEQDKGPQRTHYSITDKGKKELVKASEICARRLPFLQGRKGL
jgi:PadR family transcriptional regulator, regulatory protein PadR